MADLRAPEQDPLHSELVKAQLDVLRAEKRDEGPLSQNELNELSRKFKYYHAAVRPTAPENFLSNRNGTFFNIPLHLHLLNTRITNRELWVDVLMTATWVDERLRLRELFDRIQLPSNDFLTWRPSLVFSLPLSSQYSSLAPATGLLSSYFSIKQSAACVADGWKYPFEHFECSLTVDSEGDEILTIPTFYDMRSQAEKLLTTALLQDFPRCGVVFRFKAEWPRAVLSSYLPCILLVSCVFFAQWKRRKIQIVVSLAAVVCVLIMMCVQRPYTVATLMDLWLSVSFIHCVFLVLVDVTLPARRVRYTLMVHVDSSNQRATPVQIMTKNETEVATPFRVITRVFDKLIRQGSPRPSTTIVTASPGPSPIQRQLTTAMLGCRKRVALLLVATSYVVFCLTYVAIVLSID
ncbi:unnamed protein product [Caenorhabditis auriculariae]|uniref:Neurotransmitter-gated ion-channel ligand-binding domain-containing protein n=1 Tax=Caenorhabditis auriculariae TaxID=2777116 RepID=A0A8S1H8Y1_9PELO|nr:unnamed protein product [Caenorhabditis auriculariae]